MNLIRVTSLRLAWVVLGHNKNKRHEGKGRIREAQSELYFAIRQVITFNPSLLLTFTCTHAVRAFTGFVLTCCSLAFAQAVTVCHGVVGSKVIKI